MKTRRWMITLGTAGMVLGVAAGSRAGAQTAAMTASAAVVPIQGTVSGGAESVRFAGHAQLKANVVPDDHTGGWPTVILTIDLSKVSGVGALTGRKYVTSTQETFTRQLSAADTVEASFPFYPNGDVASAPVGTAAFHLSYNVNTLKLTGATGEIQGN
jgi:hypothetical protein